jgi:peptide/nickel transport system ATP-binding protein
LANRNGTGDVILEVKGLKTYFFTEDGVVHAVDGVDLTVRRGQTLGLVGESGCGKSVTSLSIMRLLPMSGKVVAGEVLFEGVNLLQLSETEMCRYRGNRLSMIFQQPTSCLNPVFRAGEQIAEVLQNHRGLSKEKAWDQAVENLRMVGIPDPERRAQSFPHELSGGMAQRVMIAMAFSTLPDLLIADEPTTALDVTIQAQILDLMRSMRDKLQTATILITHDMGVIAEMADEVAVMYAGQIVEQTDVRTIFAEPKHPYTQGLLASIPVLGVVKERLEVIPGTVPNLLDPAPGCRFAPRCPYRMDICQEDPPPLPVGENHWARCWLYR